MMSETIIPYHAEYSLDKNLEELGKTLRDDAKQLTIQTVNWKEYPYTPLVEVWMLAGLDALYITYSVSERCIKAEMTQTNENVYEDSCVEFFLSTDQRSTYSNFEFNCLGTCLAAHGALGTTRPRRTLEQIQQIQRVGTFVGEAPFIEQIGSFNWHLTLAIPYALIGLDLEKDPSFYGNFYKCGDHLSLPHYISLFPITTATPNFHTPEFFKKIVIDNPN